MASLKPHVTTLKERGMPKKEKSDKGLPKKEEDLGTEHEAEHAATIKQIADDAKAGTLKPVEYYQRMTAKDHLKEIPDYYTRLSKMEKDALSEKDSNPEAQVEDRQIG